MPYYNGRWHLYDERERREYGERKRHIKVLEANHHKPGKGNTVMQMKLNDVRTGAIVHPAA